MKVFGLLIVLVVGYYIYFSYTQSRDVEKLCSMYPEGARADNNLEVAEGWSGRLMGPFEAEEKSGSVSLNRTGHKRPVALQCIGKADRRFL